jgi:hydroxymethylbilane synthase
MSGKFIIGSRGSELALWQANFVKRRLEAVSPELEFEISVIKTTGDELLDKPLSAIGEKGLFTKQIENELIARNIDLAVHSLKDLQTEQPDGLVIGAVCKRETPNDVLISRSAATIDELPAGARVATGSLRRQSQLLAYRPDLAVEDMRGNLPTRIKKFEESGLDAIVLAYAGVTRLGLERYITQIIPFEIMLPAVGQGALAVEVRQNDARTLDLVRKLDDPTTRLCITAERAFLRRLEGGCQVPIGAMATVNNSRLHLDGMVGALDGSKIFRESLEVGTDHPESVGIELAEKLIDMGALRLLERSRRQMIGESEAVH